MLESKHDAQAVIDAGHPPVAAGTVLIDWDGVIQKFGMLFEGGPQAGVVEAIKRLKAEGYRIIIFTSRLSKVWHDSEGWDHEKATAEQLDYMEKFMKLHDIPYDGFTSEKIPAVAYFDDKAWRAEGPLGLTMAVAMFLEHESAKVV